MSEGFGVNRGREPSGWYDTASVAFATGFGLGYAPVASGTFGTLPGILLVAAAWPALQGRIGVQLAIAAGLSLAAIPVCGVAERVFGTKDDGRIVADEYATFPLAMIGLPVTWAEPWILPLAVLSARAFDILKPWPARQLQSIRGGLGIVIDDVVASLFALAFNHAAVFILRHVLA